MFKNFMRVFQATEFGSRPLQKWPEKRGHIHKSKEIYIRLQASTIQKIALIMV